MRPKRIFVTRHGESIGNIDWRNYFIYKDEDLMLTPKGKIQANVLGINLNNQIQGSVEIATSHYLRAKDTAEIVARALGSKVTSFRVDADLRELKWSDYKGGPNAVLQTQQRQNMGPFKSHNEGGESPYDVWVRQADVLDRFEKEWENDIYPENLVIVCHGITMLTLLMRLASIPQKKYETLATPHNCEVVELVPKGSKGYKLVTPLRTK